MQRTVMHRTRRYGLVAWAVMLATAGQLFAQRADAKKFAGPDALQETRAIVYKTVGDVSLNLYALPKAEPAKNAKRPAIVFFFGGGWNSGTPTQFLPQGRYLASHGMAVFLADYRVKSRQGVKAVECVKDAKDAIRYVRQHAEKLGVDPDRIVAAGGSAGGHIAGCTGTVPGLESDESVSSVPNAMALFNPALITAAIPGEDLVSSGFLKKLDGRLGVPAEQVSPWHHIGKHTPPTIIFHGEKDTTVAYSTVAIFAKKMEQQGRDCRLHGFKEAGHGFFNPRGKQTEYYKQTVALLDEFLTELGYLPEPKAGDDTRMQSKAAASQETSECVFENCEPKALASGRNNERPINRSGPRLAPTAHRTRNFEECSDCAATEESTNACGETPSTPDAIQIRGSFDSSLGQLHNAKNPRVAFMGGSITEMNGWRPLVEQVIAARFSDRKITFVNAGISSTCSTTGAFRLQRDVLQDQPPALLFIEFAVNDDQDAGHARRECIRGLEGIIRHTRKVSPATDIVLLHFANPGLLELAQTGKMSTSIAAHETVAKHYNVTSINITAALATAIADGTMDWKKYGGTHPGAGGNAFVAQLVSELLQTVWSRDYKPGTWKTANALPAEPLDEHSYFNGRFVSVKEAQHDDNWQVGVPDWKSLKGSKRDRYTSQSLLHSNTPGASFTLDFTGNAIGAFLLAGPDAGSVMVEIDGNEKSRKVINLKHHYSRGLHYPRTVMFATDLKPGKHQLKLTIANPDAPADTGHAVRILQFAVN